jgi:hypothetical protein
MQSGSRSSKAPCWIYLHRPSPRKLLRFLNNKSKEQASYKRKDTRARIQTGHAIFTFPSLPVPTKEEWNRVESLRPNILELFTVFARSRADVKVAWDLHIHDILEAAAEEGVVDSAAHVQIRALFNKKHNAKAPPRTNISCIIMPIMSLLNRIDSDQKMTAAEAAECLEAIHDEVARFEAMLSNPAVFEANAPDMDAEVLVVGLSTFLRNSKLFQVKSYVVLNSSK